MKPEDIEKVRRVEELVVDIVCYVFDQGPRASVPTEVAAILEVLRIGTFPPEELMFEAASALDAAWDRAEHPATL